MLDGAFAQLQELARVAEEYAGGLSDDPARLAEIERRRDLFYRLKQKYGAALSEVLATRVIPRRRSWTCSIRPIST